MDTWRDMDQVTKMTNKVKIMGFQHKNQTFCWSGRERKGDKLKKKKKIFKLLSSIYGVPLFGIRRVKSESLSTQRELHVGTKKERFHRISK